MDFLEEGAMTWNSYRGSSWQGELTPLELKAASRLRGSIYGVAGPQGCQGPEALSLHLPLALACSQWSLGTRQSWKLVSTHTTAGQLTPGPLPVLPVQGPPGSSLSAGGYQDTDGIPAVLPGPAKEVPRPGGPEAGL